MPLLVVPIAGQIEQQALKILNLASTVEKLTVENTSELVQGFKKTNRQNYPEIASAIVDHILSDNWQNMSRLVESVWGQVENHPKLPVISAGT